MKLEVLAHHKRLLMLQGPVGPFFAELSSWLRLRGVEVRKVNFCAGDALHYPDSYYAYRGTPQNWPSTLSKWLADWRPDAVLVFGDCRPYHKGIRSLVEESGATFWVSEEGYIRPDYFSLEAGGVNGNSLERGNIYKEEPVPPIAIGPVFWKMARHGAMHAIVNALKRDAWPHYVPHRDQRLIPQALAWSRLALIKGLRWLARVDARAAKQCVVNWQGQYVLVPMQLAHDSQVRVHSPEGGLPAFVKRVLSSFAVNAPEHLRLVFKRHPYDTDFHIWVRVVEEEAARLGIIHRVTILHSGHAPSLIRASRGVVTLNSTTGVSALHHGVPVLALGLAIYDKTGLTHRSGLESFWVHPEKPDAEAYRAWRNSVIERCQVNGSVYGRVPELERGPPRDAGLAAQGSSFDMAAPPGSRMSAGPSEQ